MRYKNWVIAAAFILMPMVSAVVAQADAPGYLHAYMPAAAQVGKARLKVMVWNVYDATLWAQHGQYHRDSAFALQLDYLRPLKGSEIAKVSVDEIRRQGLKDELKIADWYRQMLKIFPDVDKGITLTGVRDAKGRTIFYQNGREIGRVNDAAFAPYFFDIWLGGKTRYPAVKSALLGAR